MAIKLKHARYQKFTCADGLVKYRFVTITPSTDTVAYTATGAKPDGVTIGDEDGLVIEVLLLNNMYESFQVDAVGTIAVGDELQVSTDGQAITQTNGAVACIAKSTAVSGSVVIGYNYDAPLSKAGTPATGVTAVESGHGDWHKTVLTVSTTLPAIAGGANLAVGKLLYTFPAGAVIVEGSQLNLAITQSEGNITADTPDGGIGTTIGSGVVAVLGGTAAFENILTGQTFNDCNGTAELKTITTVLAIETSGDHTVYFNVADGWAASGDAAAALAGTVTLFWKNV